MPFKLRNLKIDRVDLVDKGDNPEAHITLFKRDPVEGEGGDPTSNKSILQQVEEIVKNILKKEGVSSPMEFNLEKFLEGLTEEQRAPLVEKLTDEVKEAVSKVMNELPEEERTLKVLDLATDLEVLKAKKEEKPEDEEKKEDEEKPDDKKKKEDEDEEEKKFGEEDEDEDTKKMLKTLPDEIRKALAESRKAKKDAEAEVEKYKTEKAIGVYIEKAKAYPTVVSDAATLGPVLKRIADVSKADFDTIDAVLKVAEEVVSKNNQIMKEIGSGGDETADAWTKMEAKAEEYRKSDTALTKESAMAKVMRDHPNLYKEYIKELE